ncbi:MAG: twin-arginine translocation signal domain-containing protein, partial [Phycisphaerales bacterium]|nr:twin-arginine translocation signal domain-containing protein [Phycisphaerales bacterium]
RKGEAMNRDQSLDGRVRVTRRDALKLAGVGLVVVGLTGRLTERADAAPAATVQEGALVARVTASGDLLHDPSVERPLQPAVGPGQGQPVTVQLPGRGVFAFTRPGESRPPNVAFPLPLEPGGIFSGVGTWDGVVFRATEVSVEPAPLPLPAP